MFIELKAAVSIQYLRARAAATSEILTRLTQPMPHADIGLSFILRRFQQRHDEID